VRPLPQPSCSNAPPARPPRSGLLSPSALLCRLLVGVVRDMPRAVRGELASLDRRARRARASRLLCSSPLQPTSACGRRWSRSSAGCAGPRSTPESARHPARRGSLPHGRGRPAESLCARLLPRACRTWLRRATAARGAGRRSAPAEVMAAIVRTVAEHGLWPGPACLCCRCLEVGSAPDRLCRASGLPARRFASSSPSPAITACCHFLIAQAARLPIGARGELASADRRLDDECSRAYPRQRRPG